MQKYKSDTSHIHFVFLRGLVRGNIHWGPTLQVFKDRFPEAQFETLEMAGNGLRTSEPSFSSVEGACDDLRSQCKSLKSGNQIVLIAISLGGMVALNWLSRFPNEIQKAFLLNTSSRLSPFYKRMKPKNYWPILTALQSNNRLEQEMAVLNITTRLLTFEEKQAYAKTFAEQKMPSKANFALQLKSAAAYLPPDDLISTKAHFLVGLKDQLADSDCSKVLIEKYQCGSSWHSEAGHDLGLDAADWLAQEVKANL